MAITANYQCSDCKRQLQEGEFIAIIGNTPPTGLSAPLGRADAILGKVGKVYCEECFKKRYERKVIEEVVLFKAKRSLIPARADSGYAARKRRAFCQKWCDNSK